MLKAILAVVAVVVLGACGAEGGTTASPDAPANDRSDVADVLEGCDFVENLRITPPEPGQTPMPLSDQQIEEAVASTPEEIRDDGRVILQTLRDTQDKSQELSALPPEEQAARTGELSEIIQRPEYREALTNYTRYVQSNCTGGG